MRCRVATSIKAKYGSKLGGILGNGMCQEGPLKDNFDYIEAKCEGVNKQLIVMT
jgi:hypothetical protein